MYETPFYVAVDHDKKKVVISIRGTLSPKVCCPRLLARPWGPPRRPRGVPLPVSCPQPRPSPVSSPHKDALTDLTGDAERLPVEGHHGTWLGHKVPTTWAPGGPWPSLPTASSWICPDGGGGRSSLLAGLTRGDWSERRDVSGRSTVVCPPGPLPGSDPDPEGPEEAELGGGHTGFC